MLSGYRWTEYAASAIASRTLGRGPTVVSLLASLIAPGKLRPGT